MAWYIERVPNAPPRTQNNCAKPDFPVVAQFNKTKDGEVKRLGLRGYLLNNAFFRIGHITALAIGDAFRFLARVPAWRWQTPTSLISCKQLGSASAVGRCALASTEPWGKPLPHSARSALRCLPRAPGSPESCRRHLCPAGCPQALTDRRKDVFL
jgi:hypothetical protein